MKASSILCGGLIPATLIIVLSGCAGSVDTEHANREFKALSMVKAMSDAHGGANISEEAYIAQEIHSNGNPPLPIGSRSYGRFVDSAMQSDPFLGTRKSSTTTLSSKTGSKQEITTDFKTLTLSLDGFLFSGDKRFNVKKKYLEIILQEEAIKSGVSGNYIGGERNRMLKGEHPFAMLVRNLEAGTPGGFSPMINITLLSMSIFKLSSSSPRLSTIAYYLQSSQHDEIDKIILSQIKKEYRNKINLEKSKDSVERQYLLKIKISDLKHKNPALIKMYESFTLDGVMTKRNAELDKATEDTLLIAEENNIDNVFDYVQFMKSNKSALNALNMAMLNASKINYSLFETAGEPETCAHAGYYTLMGMLEFEKDYGREKEAREIIDSRKYEQRGELYSMEKMAEFLPSLLNRGIGNNPKMDKNPLLKSLVMMNLKKAGQLKCEEYEKLKSVVSE